MQSSLLSSIKHYCHFLFLSTVFLIFGFSLQAQMRITEFMYSGTNGEFVEFTNVGQTAVDMTGWSFDDATRTPGVHNLSAFGVVKPGESVVVTETSPVSAFRAAWGLCDGIKVTGGYTNDNLGRADEINLYDASQVLVDRLTYNDQGSSGGPRTQNKSAWVKASGLGANAPAQWTLSAVNDAEGSFSSSGGDIGSPGKSTRATVAFNPCAVANGAPTIALNTSATSDLIDQGITVSPIASFALSGVISDPTDPVANAGVYITVNDDITPAADLVVSATSSNLQTVPVANIIINGTGSDRNIKIIPNSVGYANITISVSDGTNTSSYTLTYAASAAAENPATTRWHTGISDASDAIAQNEHFFITGDDELDVLNVYRRDSSGLPVKSFNYSSALNLPDPAKPEVDVEAATRSVRDSTKIFWLGSMSNGKSPFDNKPNRDRLFATTVTNYGAATSFAVAGYVSLRSALLTWGDSHGYAFTSSAAAGVDSKALNGFAAEGMVFAPDSSTLYIGFRAPLVPTGARTKAVIAPLLNFEDWFNNGTPSGNPVFGAPIELNLSGRGIRDIIRLPNQTYIIVAGSANETVNSALYKWTGKATDAPVLIINSTIYPLNMEGALPVQHDGALSLSQLQVITDKGGDVLYNDGVEAKSLGDNSYKKFRSDLIGNLNLNMLSVQITDPITGSSFNPANPITVTAVTSDTVNAVEFFAGGSPVGRDSVAPYTLTANEVEPGTYLVTARAYGTHGDTAVSDTVRILVQGCSATGTISAEGFNDIPGTGLISLASSAKYPNDPDVRAQLNQFEYGPNIGDNYGARVRGYICPPVTGNYIFYLSSDDQSQLFLSTNEDPQNISRIAYVDTKVGFHSWFVNAGQHSAPIHLVKGGRYYIESIHKEGTGQDHLSVGWVLPNGSFQAPIPGNRLSPFTTIQQQAPAPEFNSQMRLQDVTITGFRCNILSNPTRDHFTLDIQSQNDQTVSVKVVSISGQIIETHQQPANGQLQFGQGYKPGVYFVEATQQNKTIRIKIIKQ